jgi:uncharacterized protein YciI/heme-degrading monooxygenase HmoA
MHYLLFYEVADDYVSRRALFRDEHLEKAWKAHERNELILAGAFAHPVDGAVLLFRGDSPEVAERFARTDPYVTSGAVKRWYVREWTTVAGQDAATPVWPAARADRGAPTAPAGSPQVSGMILRMWRGRAAPEKAGDYVQHARQKVFPALRQIEGQRGAYLLRRAVDGAIEFVVITLWASMAAIARFAGPEPQKAIVEPEAQAILTSFEKFVTHFEIVHSTEPQGP